MLYQELPRIDSTPLDGWGRWFAPALTAAAAVTVAAALVLLGYPIVSGVVVVAGWGAAAIQLRKPVAFEGPAEPLVAGSDYSLVGSALGLSRDPIALTSGEGSLLVV